MKKFFFISILLVVVITLVYIYLLEKSKEVYPVEYGMSFSVTHAKWLGLDWKKVYTTMLLDLKPRYIRIAAPWDVVEPTKGQYLFDDVDWQMDEAARYATPVVLVIGQKAPRWPECHMPPWAEVSSDEEYRNALLAYVEAVTERYKNHAALEWWQVENEPFIGFGFGACEAYRRDAVYDEVALVRSIDSIHKIMVTDSGELGFWRQAKNAGDIFGTTVYRVVRTPRGRVFTHDWMPPALYRLKAQIMGVNPSKMVVSELQAEPWFHNGNPFDTSIIEQEETMNPERLKYHLDYVLHIGAPRAYLWGVEWWYFMKEKKGDPRYWDIIQEWMTTERRTTYIEQ